MTGVSRVFGVKVVTAALISRPSDPRIPFVECLSIAPVFLFVKRLIDSILQATKYLLRSGEISKAEQTIAIFTRHEGDPQHNLFEMQCRCVCVCLCVYVSRSVCDIVHLFRTKHFFYLVTFAASLGHHPASVIVEPAFSVMSTSPAVPRGYRHKRDFFHDISLRTIKSRDHFCPPSFRCLL